MATARELMRRKDQIEKLKREQAQAEGSLAQVKKDLRKEFKVTSLNKAQILLAKMNAEVKGLKDDLLEGMDELDNIIGGRS